MLNSRNIVPYSGPLSAKVWLVGEAPGQQEEARGQPFIGASGQLLRRVLSDFCGWNFSDLRVCNAVRIRPVDNKFEEFLVPTKSASPASRALGPVLKGHYIADEVLPEILHLREHIRENQPNIVLAFGNVALWALTGHSGISSYRGTLLPSIPGPKVLPTFHPAAVLRSWDFYPIVVADLLKAKREAESPLISRKPRWLTINPTPIELETAIAACRASPLTAVDIETACGHITRIGLSWHPQHAISIRLCDRSSTGLSSFYPTAAAEVAALRPLLSFLASPCQKVFQNGEGYDIPWLRKHLHCPIRGAVHDTMFLHHALMPEMQKSLGFMGSCYTDLPAWKEMRVDYKSGEEKDE